MFRQWLKRWLVSLVLLIVLLGGGSSKALALDTPPPAPPSSTSLSPELNANDIPSEKVSQFVNAYLQVVNLIDRRESELQRTETESESLQLQQQIQAEAFQLIQSAGLSQQEYWQLLGLANSDPDFRERILAQLEEADE